MRKQPIVLDKESANEIIKTLGRVFLVEERWNTLRSSVWIRLFLHSKHNICFVISEFELNSCLKFYKADIVLPVWNTVHVDEGFLL